MKLFLSHANHYLRVTFRVVSPQMDFETDTRILEILVHLLLLQNRQRCLSGHICAYLLGSTLLKGIVSTVQSHGNYYNKKRILKGN